jgi:hypothetical protein
VRCELPNNEFIRILNNFKVFDVPNNDSGSFLGGAFA